MLLAIDIGNSNVTVGSFRNGALVATRRTATDPHATPDELELRLADLLRLDDAVFADVSAIAVASVVPSLSDVLAAVAERLERPLLVASAGTVPIPIRVDRPGDVGADRLVNALAAGRLHGMPAVVVDCGTATTFDCVAADGAFVGGAIAPGIATAAEALTARAARLFRVDLARPPSAIGLNTVTNIQSGIVYGYAGLVDGLVERMRQEMGGRPRVVATGGLVGLMDGLARTIDLVNPHLTLEGLRIACARNRRAAHGDAHRGPAA